MKGEIQVRKQKLEDPMSGLSPYKRPGIEGKCFYLINVKVGWFWKRSDDSLC